MFTNFKWIKCFFFTFFAISFNHVYGQYNVNASGGTISGSYTSLSLLFDAINAGVHKGIINISVGNSDNQVINETSQALLNRSGVGASSYTGITIRPAFHNITITSSIPGSCCTPSGVIHFSAADYVKLDGRINGSGNTTDLTIENSNNSGTWASVIVFNGASHDTVSYCNIRSSSNSSNPGVGTISFLYNSGSLTGSSYNLVEFCNISAYSGSLPSTAIASSGTSSNVKNISNTISHCIIRDFKRFGIWIGNNGASTYDDQWNISDNLFYESSTITLDATNFSHYAIYIGYHNAGGSINYVNNGSHVISRNFIGGNGAGGAWNISSSSSSATLVAGGIYLACSNANYTQVNGNVISYFNVATFVSDQSTLRLAGFHGIYVYNSKVDIGSGEGNTISNIVLNHLYNSWSGIVSGIYVTNNLNLSEKISNNVISRISAETGAGLFQYFYGIYVFSGSSQATDQVVNNTITKLSLKLNSNCYGIYSAGTISQNHISRLKVDNGSAELSGIYSGNVSLGLLETYRIDNNEIILGEDSSGNPTAVNSSIYGINLNYPGHAYYNSVLIEGNHSGNTKTFCLKINSSNGTGFVASNNILYNERTGVAGSSHYAILSTSSNVITTSNNIYFRTTAANSFIGLWNNATPCAALTNWAALSGDVNSIGDTTNNKPVSVMFPHAHDSVFNNLYPSAKLFFCIGKVVIQTSDKRNRSRNTVNPTTAGAYELDYNLLVNYDTVYTFIGTGNWSQPSNWISGVVPPTVLTSRSMIIVDNLPWGYAYLDVPQYISAGAYLLIYPNKKLFVPQNFEQK